MANPADYTIATLGSHSALQILKGAKDEGFKTVAVCTPKTKEIYEHYKVADEVLVVDSWGQWTEKIEPELIKRNAVTIPHGSFIAYMGHNGVREMKSMYFGTKEILQWESDRSMEREWLEKSGLLLPRVYKKPEDIDKPVIIKFHGAGGGFGYFIANNTEHFYEVKNRKYPDDDDYAIQEYIVGVPLYAHYFYSPLTDELEIMSFDKRYESNADSIGRIRAQDQLDSKIYTSYTIVGNIPVVVRESLLKQFFDMGRQVVEESKKIAGKGLFGPFCLECIVTRKLEIYCFEISARIVAGTNPFVNGSPYSYLRYDEPMSTGRRIAREIKVAIEGDRLEEVLG